jgi:hypothetical protein
MSKIIKQRKIPPRLNVTDIEERAGFYALAQGKASNLLTKELTRKDPVQLNLFGDGEIISKDFQLYIKGYSELQGGIKQTASMLLTCLMIKATKQGLKSTLVILPLEEYMTMRGLKDEKETRAQVKRDIDALGRVTFKYKGTGKRRGDWIDISLTGGRSGIHRGNIEYRFSDDYFESYKINDAGRYLYMHFPTFALQFNPHVNPYAFCFMYRILLHKRMNAGKPNECTIGVATIIEAAANFPAYEEVMTGNRALTRRIIEPFERDLDALDSAFTWEYAGEQPTDYETFINSNIHIHWKVYPNTDKLEAGKKKRAQRTARVQANKKKTADLEARVTELENALQNEVASS